ncbi:hypothetical protein K469DRAFT_685383 [Zopfia rhizophila CBS 207.26]|uniref:Uncharacterized protein n=1 Tax=Zopfia rhizophila CBS 207.26 TaxID=1314779 RepID=A0A6A6EB82_9PEZI|nr:hypothetical protein K469DRAFT_685383 [Zopfia rhizophila CBS 207.26]
MREFSVESTGGESNDSVLEQDELCDNVGIRNQPCSTRKRKYVLFANTITSAEMLGSAFTPALERLLFSKKRLAQPQAESPSLSPVRIPTSTTLKPQARGRYLSPLESAIIQMLVTQSISSSERREDYHQDVHPDSERGEDKSNSSDSEARESSEDEINRTDDVPSRASEATLQPHNPSNRWFQERRHGSSRISPKPQRQNTIPTRPLRKLKSLSSRHLSGPKRPGLVPLKYTF